jgi:hypothetical protein
MLPSLPPLAARMHDAHAFEEQRGDGNLGPSDYTTFIALDVAATDLPAWRDALGVASASDATPPYVRPDSTATWWPEASEFVRLEFFLASKVVGSERGWVAIDRHRTRIYVFALTQ